MAAQAGSKPDPYYSHKNTAHLCAWFIKHLFACPEYPPTSSSSNTKLPFFVAYALYHTKLHFLVMFAALVLLQRLKARFPTTHDSSGHHLFISAFMIASKVICDDTYSNRLWSIISQGMFQLREINQMEWEMCQYLDWELNVEPGNLKKFEDFTSPGHHSTCVLQTISKLAATSTTPSPLSHLTTLPPLSLVLVPDLPHLLAHPITSPDPPPPKSAIGIHSHPINTQHTISILIELDKSGFISITTDAHRDGR